MRLNGIESGAETNEFIAPKLHQNGGIAPKCTGKHANMESVEKRQVV
jgi:hypothetical protein